MTCHLCKDKKLKWHIYYLLASPHAMIAKLTQFLETEYELNQNTAGIILIEGIGASDSVLPALVI